MSIHITEDYNLPDSNMLRSGDSGKGLKVWVPKNLMVVVGKGSDPEEELLAENILLDHIPVIRRGTGGCAVVLSPEMVVVSFVVKNNPERKQNEYFSRFVNAIVGAFKKLGVRDIEMRGISDIAINGLKVAGSSIFRSKHYVFFHSIINLAGNTRPMERYLKLPPREPDYRMNRSHKDFVTSFKEAGYDIDILELEEKLKSEWLLYFK
jgi:lipoate-protein ligase A